MGLNASWMKDIGKVLFRFASRQPGVSPRGLAVKSISRETAHCRKAQVTSNSQAPFCDGISTASWDANKIALGF